MAHQLDIRNGKAAMAYVGDVAWHGLGQRLTEGAPLETWRKEAGMDWTIGESPLLYAPNGNANSLRQFKGKKVLSRSDTGFALSVVGDEYKPVNPGEVLEFFRDLIADNGFSLETAGVLYRGRKFWALARCGKPIRIMGQDEIAPYLLLATACDGSMATVADPTSIRVVCDNTLRMAIGAHGERGRVKVYHNAKFLADEVKEQLGLVEQTIDNFAANVVKLAGLKIDRNTAIDIVAAELKREWEDEDGEKLTQDQMLSSSRTLRRIMALFQGEAKGADFRSSKGTAWGLVNAVTQHFDHEIGVNNVDNSRAFERAHLGDRANFKQKVADRLLALAA